jgi:hypothetical protein
MRIEITREIIGNKIEYRVNSDEKLDESGKKTFTVDSLDILFNWLYDVRDRCRVFGKLFEVVRKPTQLKLF